MIAALIIGACLMSVLNLALHSKVSTKALIHLDAVIVVCTLVVGMIRHG